MQTDRIVQALFAIQLTLFGIALVLASGERAYGALLGGLGLLVGLIALAGRSR